MRRHFIIPDRQAKPGVPLEHNRWIGEAIAKYEPDVVIDMGDGVDFQSLSRHSGPMAREGQRLKADFDAYNESERLLREGMGSFKPKRMVRLHGNHERRLTKFLEENPVLEGLIDLSQLNSQGWEMVPYVGDHPGVIQIDGIWYAHYFAQPNTGNAVTGTIATRIARIGGSFVQGHQQGLMRGDVPLATGRTYRGVAAGSCYLHDEGYKGVANTHFRGVVVLNDVRNGQYLEMPLDIDYLCRQSTGTTVARWLQRNRRNAKERYSLARSA